MSTDLAEPAVQRHCGLLHRPPALAGCALLFLVMMAGLLVPPQPIVVSVSVRMKEVPLSGGKDLLGQGRTGWLDTHGGLIVPDDAWGYIGVREVATACGMWQNGSTSGETFRFKGRWASEL